MKIQSTSPPSTSVVKVQRWFSLKHQKLLHQHGKWGDNEYIFILGWPVPLMQSNRRFFPDIFFHYQHTVCRHMMPNCAAFYYKISQSHTTVRAAICRRYFIAPVLNFIYCFFCISYVGLLSYLLCLTPGSVLFFSYYSIILEIALSFTCVFWYSFLNKYFLYPFLQMGSWISVTIMILPSSGQTSALQ